MLQFVTILIALTAVVAAIMILMRPHWAFVLVICLFPIEQLLYVYVPVVAANPRLVNIAVGSLALMALLLRLGRGERIVRSYQNPVTYCVIGLYVLWVLGIFWSPSRDVFLAALSIDLVYILLLVGLLPLLVSDIAEFRRTLYGLMVVGAVISILIIFNPRSSYHAGRLMLDLGMFGSVKDTGNPLAVASMGAIAALIAVFIRPERPTFLLTAMRIGAFVAGFGVAIGSGSRGQVLAAGIVGIVFFPISRKLANPKQFFVVTGSFLLLCAGILVVFQLFIGEQNVQRWDPMTMLEATAGRLEMAFLLYDHYLASPAHWIFGLGTGYYSSISREQIGRDYVHNVMAEVLCEHGLVGALLFAIAGIVLFLYALRLWRMYRDDPPYRAVIALLAAICVFSLLEALKQGSMNHPAPFYWWLVMAKIATTEFRAQESVAAIDQEAAWAEEEFDDANLDPDGAVANPHEQGYALGS